LILEKFIRLLSFVGSKYDIPVLGVSSYKSKSKLGLYCVDGACH